MRAISAEFDKTAGRGRPQGIVSLGAASILLMNSLRGPAIRPRLPPLIRIGDDAAGFVLTPPCPTDAGICRE
jgi:hypothetical protein